MNPVPQLVDRTAAGCSWRQAGELGAPGAPAPVVLLHGLTGSRLSWEPQLTGLGVHRPVLAWDTPGYGAAEPLPSPVTFAHLADAVARLADTIGAEQVHLVGVSFGGMIAQYATHRHPGRVRSLSLLATSPKFGLDGTDPTAWRQARLAALDDGQEPRDFAPTVLRAIAGPHISERALAGQVAAAGLVPGAALRTSIDVLVTHDTRHLLGRLHAPTQCLVGELDGETPVEYAAFLAEHIPGAELHVLPGAGHLLNVEAPDEVNRLILRHVELVDADMITR